MEDAGDEERGGVKGPQVGFEGCEGGGGGGREGPEDGVVVGEEGEEEAEEEGCGWSGVG